MLLLALAALFQSPPNQPVAVPPPITRTATLDTALASKDYGKLVATVRSGASQDDLRTDLDWLKAKMMAGETAFVTMLYARLLWSATEGMPPEQASPLRQTAGMAMLYAQAAIQIDGARCGDRSAPSHRLTQLASWIPGMWTFIGSLSEQDRAVMLALVPRLEQRTAASRDQRGDVDFLCRSGLEETTYNLKHGKAREVPAKPGQIGRQIELSGDGKYQPSVRPEAEWKVEAEKLRASLPERLAAQLASQSSRQ